MRIIVVGGYGAFGERLVRLLVRDGHDVWIAGRSEQRANALAATLNAHAIRFDRLGDFAVIASLNLDVLIDAAGPFQSYGDAPYRLPSDCIATGMHYLDLSDDADFCAGIRQLDGAARKRGCYALSGVSSVPALSAAAVRALSEDFVSIEQIDSAILPGNRAPRGPSVIASIVGQCGAPRRIWQGGRWVAMRGWSKPRDFFLGDWGRRRAWLIGVPDLDLFPTRFNARSVSFRAGLELRVMNWGLALLSALRARWPFALRPWLLTSVRWAAVLLWPFGSARGGMVVEVTGRLADTPWSARLQRTWTLRADRGVGPFVPAIAARSILKGAAPAPGARACLDEVSLSAAEAAMADLDIDCLRSEQWLHALFAGVSRIDWPQLPERVRESHAVFGCLTFAGRAAVTRGHGPIARCISSVFGFPPAVDDVAVEVVKTRRRDGERWQRRFGDQSFRSDLSLAEGRIVERFGPFAFELDLYVEGGALCYPLRRGWLCGIPLPRLLLPESRAREYVEDERFRFDIAIHAPLGIGLLVHYRGWLAPVDEAPPRPTSDG